MFDRPHHQRIAHVLRSLDGELLKKAHCYFGGGTAIVLQCGEYRESVDVDFMCADTQGYRQLREAITPPTLGGLLRHPIKQVRDVRTDRDKISTFLEVDGIHIKFELVREARIEFEPSTRDLLGVPMLDPVDAYAEKLLANADRGMDRSTLSRDMIDLAMMIDAWGAIPARAWEKAQEAYGAATIRQAWNKGVALLSDDVYLLHCMQSMSMDPALLPRIQAHLQSCPPSNAIS